MNVSDQRILRSIIVPLAAAIIGLLLAVMVGVYWLINSEDQAQVGKIVTSADKMLRSQMEEEEETLKVGMSGVLDNQAFAAPLRAGDRAGLLNLALPIFKAIHPDAQVTHFYFGTLDGATLLRVHSPTAFGGPFDHGLSVKAVQSGKSATGLELGGFGALSLRVSSPYRDNGEIIGVVQQGLEFQHIADVVHHVLGIDILILIDKTRLEQANWERGRAYFGWPLPWERFPAVVLNNSTLPILPDPVAEQIAKAPTGGDIATGYVKDGGRILYLAPIPLLDAEGQRLGNMMVVIDRTSLISGSHILMVGIAVLCLCVAVLLIGLFHRIIRKVETRIGQGIAGLARANADLERVAFMACHELQEPLEQVVTSGLELQQSCSLFDEKCAHLLRQVGEGAQRLEQTVGTLEDYLDLDINARKMEVVDLNAVFVAALEKVQPHLRGRAITVAPLPKVLGRPLLLARTLLCILDYVLRAGPPVAGSSPLTVWAEETNDSWNIWFAGLPEGGGDLAQALESNPELAVARRTAQLHGGDLSLACIPHHGMVIVLSLRSKSRPQPEA